MTLLELRLSIVAVAIVLLITNALMAQRRARQKRERQYMGTVTRLAWMMVNERPSKVVYFTKEQVDGSIDVPHLKLEITPNGYALRALTAPSTDATHAITVNG